MKVDALRGPEFWDEVVPLLMEPHPELSAWMMERPDLASTVLFRTSGSSGIQKWIVLSKAALRWSAERVVDYLGLDASDVCALVLPVHHVGGFGVVARCEVSGARLVKGDAKWSPHAFGELCERERVTVSSLVPTQVKDLVDAEIRASSSLRAVIVGGGQLEEELAAQARLLGWPALASYGMTETASQVATGEGLPLLPGWEARIRDECLELKGEGLLQGVVTESGGQFHFEDPKVDGWFLTSDRVLLDQGHLTIMGRADRRVKVLGELIDLEALEEFWSEQTGGAAALIAYPDERRHQTLHLFFEGAGDGIEQLNRDLPGPERLESWRHLDPLPRTSLGKVDRLKMTEIHLD